MIFLILLIVLICIIFFTISGIGLCKEENYIGIVLLFLGLNLLGLIIGVCIIQNAKNGMYKDRDKDKDTKLIDKINNINI